MYTTIVYVNYITSFLIILELTYQQKWLKVLFLTPSPFQPYMKAVSLKT